ncbi:MAG: voltage-gated potassium channel [Ulvibacter sp.]|jgi:voltage-gated potassium channel
MPDKSGGEHMASLVVVPNLIEFLDNLFVSGVHDSMNVEQISFDKVCADGAEKAIVDLDLRNKQAARLLVKK